MVNMRERERERPEFIILSTPVMMQHFAINKWSGSKLRTFICCAHCGVPTDGRTDGQTDRRMGLWSSHADFNVPICVTDESSLTGYPSGCFSYLCKTQNGCGLEKGGYDEEEKEGRGTKKSKGKD